MKHSILTGMAALPAIDGLPITANNGEFWIGKLTTATCPSYDPDCPSRNTTIISGPTYAQTWWMGVLEEGGQRIFTPTNGQPGYSAADSDNYTPARVSYSYTLQTANTTDGRFLLKYYTRNWAAFPTEDDGVWAVYAQSAGPQGASTCLPFAWELRETTAPAPQYYNCEGCESRCNNIYGTGCK
ncbi:hypothetical protein AUEXF2481DRAFT_264380 [Aureobasidium subglaciale EXF-2481]|uniref:Uncharacterized protein n=1 Tax=Aureobasidium subglaciale (strain EXF-2481) TaxID=1043005 RepID=A0A074YJL0_AURSE|nr:uncharacterized protein AUEXF2481DRAFT_264380 [Aureobasidium subglaciale EXF-2481]KEQ94277.1 hypothetical protein AUEXF2481DRAFT_264380 [Aureobasidium subglaciale EXF-2481]